MLMSPLFRDVDCGLYCEGFDAEIMAPFSLVQRFSIHKHLTRCTLHRVLDETPH